MFKNKKVAVFALFILLSNFVYIPFAYADTATDPYFINLDKSVVEKGYTVSIPDKYLKISIAAGVLKNPTGVKIEKVQDEMMKPWQINRVGTIYQYELTNKTAYDGKKPLVIDLKYDNQTNYYKQVFFYDKTRNSWRQLDSVDYPDKMSVRASIALPFARIAVFDNPEILVSGKASWYSHKKGLFAASPDFPAKSKLRVTNTKNNKSVIVEINDFGPDRSLHPDRVVDLEKTAFAKLASTREGTISIKVQPVYIPKGVSLGINSTGAKAEPEISSKSAIVMDEKTGEILWEKNATSTRPLASLSKMVAIKVFLDARPTLNKVVSYSAQDEEYNYKYCKRGESARVTLKDGEKVTIEDLLYSALVGSANNAVESLVRVSGFTRDEFIAKMNESVISWGATSTHFEEPTGLSPNNVSSAKDYAIISKEVFTNPIIQKASTMAKYKFSTIDTRVAHTIKNTNKLFATTNLNITGSKTGYLDEALYCLMVRAKSNTGRQIIAVTMGTATREKSFSETEELIRYTFIAK